MCIIFKKLLTLICILSIFGLSSGATYAADQMTAKINNIVKIPSGTVIPIVFKYPLNSDGLQVGDLVSISINRDIIIDDKLVFKQGTDGVAYIDKVIRSGQHGRKGVLSIREAKVIDVTRQEHPIQLNVSAQGDSKRPSAIFLSVIGVALILVPFGIWRTGTPANISAARVFEGFITSPSEIVIK